MECKPTLKNKHDFKSHKKNRIRQIINLRDTSDEFQLIIQNFMMWCKVIRKIISVLSIVIAFIFINHGVERLLIMTTDQKDEFSVFKYMHAIEIIIIGIFFLLVECKSPLFKQNIYIMFRPTPKTVLILILAIFLYTGTDNQLDFYLVMGMGGVMLLLSFYTKKAHPQRSLLQI